MIGARIRTSHVGSRPRPRAAGAIAERECGGPQIDVGLDIVQRRGDGEGQLCDLHAQPADRLRPGRAHGGLPGYQRGGRRHRRAGRPVGPRGVPDRRLTRRLAVTRATFADDENDLRSYRRLVAQNVAALNPALRDIPPERVRLHMCWGNYEGPRHRDVPLRDVLDIVLTTHPGTISFEGANPQHGHEWSLFAEVTLPDDKVIMPGVIDSTTHTSSTRGWWPSGSGTALTRSVRIG